MINIISVKVYNIWLLTGNQVFHHNPKDIDKKHPKLWSEELYMIHNVENTYLKTFNIFSKGCLFVKIQKLICTSMPNF